MSLFSDKKDINVNLVHNATQIMELVKHVSESLKGDVTAETVRALELLYKSFVLAEYKLHPCFGNNIAKTDFSSLFNNLIIKYLEGEICGVITPISNMSERDVLNRALHISSNLAWNCSDTSEVLCKVLMQHEELKSNIVKTLSQKPYNEENKNLIESSLAIINNVSRREPLRDSFKLSDVCESIITLRSSPLMGRVLSIVCVATIYYIAPNENLKQYSYLANDIVNDVIEIIDAASNSENFEAEGFSIRELLEVLTIISRDSTAKELCGRNHTLLLTLIRLLCKKNHQDQVIRLAKIIYNANQFQNFKDRFKEKSGHSEATILNLFN